MPAFNLHPSVLPAGRGPKPARLSYDGDQTIGATLHRAELDFGTGAILSQRERALPPDLSGPGLLRTVLDMLAEVLEEGAPARSPRRPEHLRTGGAASYSAAFTEADELLDPAEPATTLRRPCDARWPH